MEGPGSLSSKEGGDPSEMGLCLLHPVPSPGPRPRPKPSLGHVDGSKHFTDVTCSEPGNRGGSSCREQQRTRSPFSARSVIFVWKPCWKI